MYELSPGYLNDPTQKSYIWTSFHTSRRKLNKLKEAIWRNVIKEIFKTPPRVGPFSQINYLYSNKLFVWILFRFRATQFRSDTIGTVSRLLERNFVNSLNFYHSGNPFSKWAVSLTFVGTAWDTDLKNDTFGLVSSFFLHISY